MFQLFRSASSFFWSMSILGLQQLMMMTKPGVGVQHASMGFQTMSQQATEQLQGPFRQVHRAGEEMQSGMVDTVEGFLSPQALHPARALTLSCGFWQRSMRAMGQLFTPSKNTGSWGQMPPL